MSVPCKTGENFFSFQYTNESSFVATIFRPFNVSKNKHQKQNPTLDKITEELPYVVDLFNFFQDDVLKK